MSNKFKKTVNFFTRLPGIGPRQAARIVLAMLAWPPEELLNFSQAMTDLNQGLSFCQDCFNFSEQARCDICSSSQRDPARICLVEKITDLESIEKGGFYRGLYHILGGTINPLEGFLPQHLKIEPLLTRIKKWQTEHQNGRSQELEIILATNPNTYGETTALYLEEILRPTGVKISRLAKGLASGSYLEYADALTLQNAFKNRR